MKYYYIVMEYYGWDIFQTDIPVFQFMHDGEAFYYVTTCLDNARGIVEILRNREDKIWEGRQQFRPNYK